MDEQEKLKAVENFNGYLHMLCRNYMLSMLERQDKELHVRRSYSRDAIPVVMPDEIITNKECEQSITEAVSGLPKKQQLVYKLSREHGWKRNKIAQELKLSPFTVKNHIQKALDSLRVSISAKEI